MKFLPIFINFSLFHLYFILFYIFFLNPKNLMMLQVFDFLQMKNLGVK
jgi:hypothetical protein